MIQKKDLKGRFVSYLDSEGKQRIDKVIRISGNTLTVRNVIGRRRRVKQNKVLGRMRPKLGMEEIEW